MSDRPEANWRERINRVLGEYVGEKSAKVIFQMAHDRFGANFTTDQFLEVLKTIFGDVAAETIWTKISKDVERRF